MVISGFGRTSAKDKRIALGPAANPGMTDNRQALQEVLHSCGLRMLSAHPWALLDEVVLVDVFMPGLEFGSKLRRHCDIGGWVG